MTGIYKIVSGLGNDGIAYCVLGSSMQNLGGACSQQAKDTSSILGIHEVLSTGFYGCKTFTLPQKEKGHKEEKSLEGCEVKEHPIQSPLSPEMAWCWNISCYYSPARDQDYYASLWRKVGVA